MECVISEGNLLIAKLNYDWNYLFLSSSDYISSSLFVDI